MTILKIARFYRIFSSFFSIHITVYKYIEYFSRVDSVQPSLIHFRHLLRIVKGFLIDNPFTESFIKVALGLMQVPHGPIKVFVDFHKGCADGRSQTSTDTEPEGYAVTSYDIIKMRKG